MRSCRDRALLARPESGQASRELVRRAAGCVVLAHILRLVPVRHLFRLENFAKLAD